MLRVTVAMGLAAGFMLACATAMAPSGGIPEVDVTLVQGQGVDVSGHVVPQDQMVSRLRSCGAGQDTVIRIRFQPGQDQPAFADIAQTLRRSGYQKIIFVGPKQVKASVQ